MQFLMHGIIIHNMEVKMKHKIGFVQYTKQISLLSKYDDETALFECKHCNKRLRIPKKYFGWAKIINNISIFYCPIILILFAIFNINKRTHGSLMIILIYLIGYLCWVCLDYIFYLFLNRKLTEIDSNK